MIVNSFRKRSNRCNYYNQSKKQKSQNADNNCESSQEEEDHSSQPVNFLDLLNSKQVTVYRKSNHIYFRDEVNDDTINKMGKLIDDILYEYDTLSLSLPNVTMQPKPIYLHITTDGGSLFAGLMGADLILNSKIPVHTIVEGRAASAGTIMSIVGTKRYMTANAYILIHQLSSIEHGNYEQLKDGHKNNTQLMKHINNLYSKHTKISKKELNECLKHDVFWNFDKSLKVGLIDELYAPSMIYQPIDD